VYTVKVHHEFLTKIPRIITDYFIEKIFHSRTEYWGQSIQHDVCAEILLNNRGKVRYSKSRLLWYDNAHGNRPIRKKRVILNIIISNLCKHKYVGSLLL